jgi:hypothetical protein
MPSSGKSRIGNGTDAASVSDGDDPHPASGAKRRPVVSDVLTGHRSRRRTGVAVTASRAFWTPQKARVYGRVSAVSVAC